MELRAGEAIQIGPDIKVKILRFSAARVTIAVCAPRGLRITRIDKPTAPETPIIGLDLSKHTDEP